MSVSPFDAIGDTRYVSPAKTAEMLDLSERTVHRLISDGVLPAVHVGRSNGTRLRRSVRISVTDIQAMLEPIRVAGGDAA